MLIDLLGNEHEFDYTSKLKQNVINKDIIPSFNSVPLPCLLVTIVSTPFHSTTHYGALPL